MNSSKLAKRYHRQSLMVGLSIFLLSLLALSSNSEVLASQIGDLQDKLQQVNKQIAENKELAKEAQEETTTLQGIMNRLQRDINSAQSQIKSLEASIKKTESEIASKNKAIATKEKELEIQKIHQNEIIKTLYETDENNVLLILAGAGSITDLISHAEYLETLESDIELTMDTIQSLKDELEDEKASLEEKKKKLASSKAQQQAYRAGLVDDHSDQAILKSEAERQLTTYQSKIASAEKMRKQFEAEIAQMNSRLRGGVQARDRGVSAVGFQWPTNGVITQYFGTPNWSAAYRFHDGLDIASACGTPVYAAASGTVMMADYRTSSNPCRGFGGGYWPGSWGNQVMIGHNARFNSRYAHLQSVIVSPGQEVKRGQIIGYMGSTGYSTGVHLHFSIFEYGTAKNPLNYLP